MTLSTVATVCAGITINALTFALGILVGASLSRKDLTHARNRHEEAKNYWHNAERR